MKSNASWSHFYDLAGMQDHLERTVPRKKDDFISYLSEYSYDLPTFKQRLSLLDFWNESSGHEKSLGVVLAVFFSTSRVEEFEQAAETIAALIEKVIIKNIASDLLDYVLSADWGKFLLFPLEVQIRLIQLGISNRRFIYSDEFAVFLLKAFTANELRGEIVFVTGEAQYIALCCELLQRVKGRTGGLAKQTAFLLRRQPRCISSNAKIPDQLIEKIIDNGYCDDQGLFSVLSILTKIAHVNLPLVFNKLRSANPNVYQSIAYILLGPSLIWSEIQRLCLMASINPYFSQAINTKSLDGFYNALGHTPASKKYNGEKHKIGVVITTKNPDLVKLSASILSVLNQGYKNLTVYLVDDCSDAPWEAGIKQLVDELNSSKVLLIRNEVNLGQYESRNIAIETAKDCEYFAIQDDDDFSHPDRLSEQLALLISSSSNRLVMCLQARFTENMEYVPDRHIPYTFDKSPATSFFSRETYESVGGFRNVRTRGDTEYIQRIKHMFGSESVVAVNAPLYMMRCHSDTISASKDRTLKTQLDVFRTEMGKPKPFSSDAMAPWALGS